MKFIQSRWSFGRQKGVERRIEGLDVVEEGGAEEEKQKAGEEEAEVNE